MVRLPVALALSLAAIAASAFPLPAQEFETADDLVVRPATTPGLTRHPMMAALDDRGRLFIAENAGVNLKRDELLEDPPSFIRLVEDTDGDGTWDKSTIFADKLTFPQGALWLYDSLYVMSPPSLWRFADEDGDGVAEVREELATGFEFTGNAADVHGPYLHPNGRIFWCHGRKGYAVPDRDTGDLLHEGKGARIWSSHNGGGDVEPFAGGGLDNPVEVDFTDRGEVVGSVNLFYGRPRGDTLVHWVHGGAYPRFDQKPALEGLKRTGDLLPEVHNFGHVAVSGMCRYRSGALRPDWADQWLVSHFNTARITRTRFVREGSSFVAAETEAILEFDKPDAHFTDVLEDHNGDLLVVDTGGWFRIGCPTSHIAKPDVAGGIYRVSKKGKPYRRPRYPDWNRLSTEAVAALLDADEEWIQERAGIELAMRGEPALPELKRLLQSPDSHFQARRNVVWTLAKMRFSEAADLVFEALVDPDPSVRQAAANAISVTRNWQVIAANQPAEREIELSRNRTISGALARIVRSDDPPVARQAAVALGRMGESRAIGAILGRLGRTGDDRMLEHSLVYALIEIDDEKATRPGLTSENPETVRGALLALDQMPSAKLQVLDILPFLESSDSRLKEAVTRIATAHPEWDAALANRFFEWIGNLDEPRLATLARIVPPLATTPPIQDFLTQLLQEDAQSVRLALQLLTEAPGVAIADDWKPVLRKQLGTDAPPETRALALQVLASAPDSAFQEELEALAGDESLPRITRIRAAQGLAKQQSVLTDPAFAMLLDVLGSETDPAIRSQAIGILAKARLTRDRKTAIAGTASKFSPVEMQALMQIFRKVDDEEQAVLLADALVASPAFASLDPDRLRQIFRPFEAAVLGKVEKKIAEVESEKSRREERIDSLVASVAEGDPAAGKEVFATGKGSCLVCHRVEETGGRVGPDLSTIGRIRTARDLFESILYPSESIARDFETWEIRFHDSARPPMLGLIESRDAFSIVLIDPAGQRHTVPAAEVSSVSQISTSLMLPGLEQTLTPEELRDLVAWMLERK